MSRTVSSTHARMLAAILTLLAAGGVRAQGPVQRARALFARGQTLFSRGAYREAMRRFAKGYELSHRPGFLFNMAECARLLGDRKAAHPLYVRYLREDARGRYRAEAIRRCEALELGPCLTPPPPPAPAPVVPGAVLEGRRATLAPVSASTPPPAATAPTVAVSMRPPPPRPVERPFYKKWPLWVGIGAVVVAGGVTAAVLATRGGGASSGGDPVLRF